MLNWRQSTKVQRSSCTPKWYCERRFRVLCSIHRTRIISISNDSSKSHGYHLQIDKLRWTSRGRSICSYPSENGRCSQIIENFKIGMSRHLDSSTTTQMAKIMVQSGRPSRSSWTESVRSPFGKTIMEKAILENPFKARLGESFQLGMSLRTQSKRIVLICVCGWPKVVWTETRSWPDVESTQQRSRFGRTNIFPWSCILGMHSKTMWNKQRYCWQLESQVWITFFRGRNWKSFHTLRIFVFPSWSYDMEGRAKKCVERYCELANRTTQQLYKVSTPCIDDHLFKEEEMKSVGELSHVCSQIVLKCLYLARIGPTWYSMVSK